MFGIISRHKEDNTRILVLTTTFPRWKGDTTPSFVYDLSKRIRDENIQTVILAPYHEGSKKYEDIDGMIVYRFPYFWPTRFQELAYDGGMIRNIQRSILAKIQIFTFLISQIFYILVIGKREKIDIIHSHWIIPNGLTGAFCGKIMRKKHVLTEHAGGIVALKNLPCKKRIADFIYANSQETTAVSRYMRDQLLDLVESEKGRAELKQHIEIIPMGIHTEEFYYEENKEDLRNKYSINHGYVLLFIGRLAEKKGIEHLIRSMPLILKREPNLSLLICGDGPLRGSLEQMTRDLGLDEKVNFIGYISNNEKRDYLHLSDVLIVPSVITSSGDTEGLPVVIMEGLASGIPIVASDVGGISDAIIDGYNGYLVEQRDINQLSDKILDILFDDDKRQEFKQNALKTSKEFDWDIVGKKYIELLKV